LRCLIMFLESPTTERVLIFLTLAFTSPFRRAYASAWLLVATPKFHKKVDTIWPLGLYKTHLAPAALGLYLPFTLTCVPYCLYFFSYAWNLFLPMRLTFLFFTHAPYLLLHSCTLVFFPWEVRPHSLYIEASSKLFTVGSFATTTYILSLSLSHSSLL